ncbi:hypothetical protein D4764_11G0000320 [Takifugu flavidus]|uniref:Uncharacterized protein n=1 Tax=Takifugu flavidus TaxID=433684 RepID=A0A5C6PGH0_9TELE|nr:hypothetical protein D4764_11G0000320 [Takifugu flavidus]
MAKHNSQTADQAKIRNGRISSVPGLLRNFIKNQHRRRLPDAHLPDSLRAALSSSPPEDNTLVTAATPGFPPTDKETDTRFGVSFRIC